MKSISEVGAYCMEVAGGLDQEHGSDVHEVSASMRLRESTAKRRAATWEHASPRPAMQVQWAQMIAPSSCAPTHGHNGGAEYDCECFTLALTRNFLRFSPTRAT